jgi:hypothetical protein
MITKSKINETRKSTKQVRIELAGIIILGKYTLVIKEVFPIKLEEASFIELLKNCHGNIPVNTIMK